MSTGELLTIEPQELQFPLTMQAQREAPLDMQCKDKFLLQSVVASPGATTKDITPDMFNKESGNHVEECKLRVAYVSPPQPPSPVQEGSDEGTSPRASLSDNGNVHTSDFPAVQTRRAYVESQDTFPFPEANSVVTKLTEEKISAIQQCNKLQQELDLLRREGNRSRGGVPLIYIVVFGLLGVLLGYILRKT
ncbi:hypothetical protein RJ641_016999 [Dillenia turbinata]|uniref:MSP domain-containing protein n=1 Tax=Dillenia turbinata TaxID=194707 RepID=A0AAN8UXB7_9MAGN